MTRKAVFRPQADQEVRAARQWYEEQRPGLGIQFANAIDEAVERIASNPLAFPSVHGETRRAVVRRFPYGIYFRVLVDDIVHHVGDARSTTSAPLAGAPMMRRRWRLFETNAALDRLTADADIARPDTPRPGAPDFPLAGSTSVLLRDYFQGGEPGRVDADLVPDVRAASAEREDELGSVTK